MKDQTPEQVIPDQQADLLRVLYMIRITKNFIDDYIVKNEALSDSIKNGTFRAVRELGELERKLDNITTNEFPWLKRKLESNTMWDISSIIDLLGRISNEENPEYYEAFLALLVNAINGIFYMNKDRNTLSLEKYKYFLQLAIEEANRDKLSLTRQQFIVIDKSVWFRLTPIQHEEILKTDNNALRYEIKSSENNI